MVAPPRRRMSGPATGILVLALLACESPVDPVSDAGPVLASPADGWVSKPFKARFFTDLASLAPDPSCEAGHFLNTQVGEGVATHLGRFTVVITFCVDITDLLDDGQLTEGESVPYSGGEGVLVAANRDELYLTSSGAVLPSTDPRFDFEFQDPFTFVGGTGRFAGASGGGMTDSFVTQATDRTLHNWMGTLELPRP